MNTDQFTRLSDQELLQRYYADGNTQWLGILLQRYTLLLLGVCMKYLKNEEEAKDAVQQIFLKVITELQKYPVSYFKSWLYMIARNHCLMQLRNHNGKKISGIDETFQVAEETIPLENHLQKDQLLSCIEEGMHLLTAEQKTCVTLFYLNKKSYHEITAQTGFSLLQVKSYIQNGKRNLKIFIEKKMKR